MNRAVGIFLCIAGCEGGSLAIDDTGDDPEPATPVVEDATPVVEDVTVVPSNPAPNNALVCSGTGVVADAGAVTLAYRWEVDGVDAGLATDTVPSGRISVGEAWRCIVTPSAAGGEGEPGAADVTVRPRSLREAWRSTERDGFTEVAWADVDGDGDLDLAAASTTGIHLFVQGADGFGKAWSSEDQSDSMAVAWGDVDGDGDPDLATVARAAGSNVELYRNEAGELTHAWTSSESTTSLDLAFEDFDRDGLPDLAVAGDGVPTRIYRNDAGNLVSFWTNVSFGPHHGVAWGDLDGDGRLDLGVAVYQAPQRVYLQTSEGTFSTESTGFGSSNLRGQVMAWGHLDDDIQTDVAVAASANQSSLVWRNDGGEVQPPLYLDAGNSVWVGWADWDLDGDEDLAETNFDGQQVRLYANNDAVLSRAWTGPDEPDAGRAAWGDFDGDGDPDLAVPHGVAGIVVYENGGF